MARPPDRLCGLLMLCPSVALYDAQCDASCDLPLWATALDW